MKAIKALTIRLSEQQAEALATFASVEAQPVSEIIRTAIDEHLQRRSSDPAFQSSLRESIKRVERLLR